MKKLLTLLICLAASLLFIAGKLNAQNILFQEDFETSPITSFINTGYDDMPDGSSPCGKASRGNTSDFNSANVDFNSSENSTYFMGVNPESPCGGFYEASITGPTLDMSGLSDPYIRGRYFIGEGLNYGYAGISIEFDNGTTTHQINSEFTERNTWTDFELALPVEMIHPSVEIILYMGGGEGVGLDDFTIQDGPTPVCENNSSNISETACSSFTFDGSELTSSGEYMATFTNQAGCDSLVTLNLTIFQPDVVTENVNSCISYLFDGNTLTSSGQYEGIFQNTNGCDSTVTLNLTIISSPDATVTKDGVELSATDNSNYSYQWLDCDNGDTEIAGATSSSFIPSASGNYAVQVSVDDCISISDCVFMDWVTSVSQNDLGPVEIYPNITNGMVNVNLFNISVKPVLQIWDMSGSLINEINLEGGNNHYQVNMPTKNGLYLIKIYDQGHLLTTKRIIKSN